MNLGIKGESIIKSFETLRLVAYKPTPHDVWTIGWGHTRDVKEGDACTLGQAQAFFEGDVKWAVDAVRLTCYDVPLSQNQFDALVSFVFNVGAENFKGSTLLRDLLAGDYKAAAGEFARWNKQGGVVLNGLTRRREAERDLYEQN